MMNDVLVDIDESNGIKDFDPTQDYSCLYKWDKDKHGDAAPEGVRAQAVRRMELIVPKRYHNRIQDLLISPSKKDKWDPEGVIGYYGRQYIGVEEKRI